MNGWDADEEPTGEPYRRMPPRGNYPREPFDATRGTGYSAPTSAASPAMGSRRRPASRRLRSAGLRVGSALGWVGLLVIAPLIVGILAGAIGQHLGI